MAWITHRNPREEELQVTLPGVNSAYGEFFLTWDGEMVDIDFFEIPSRKNIEPVGPVTGFWHRAGVLAWCPLPLPPSPLDTETEGG